MKNVSIYVDLAFCLIVLPLMMFFFPVERWWGTCPVFFGLVVCWLYISYFTYKYFIMPGVFFGGRHRICALAAIVVSLSVTFLFSSYRISSPFFHIRQQLLEQYSHPLWGVRPSQQAVWLYYIIVVIFCLATGMLAEAYRQRMAREAVEYERNKAELALYKAQINPHFLFNTLNTLYGLLITHSDRTKETLERFISLTRYMYDNANREFIAVAEEVEYIGQYVGLQKLRLNRPTDVSFTHQVEDGTMPVPPMLLITFVENAFKYGISSDESCFVRISLRQQGDILCFRVENSVVGHDVKDSRRTGIENCRRRLSLLYPGRHRLAISCEDNIFRVCLELQSGNI